MESNNNKPHIDPQFHEVWDAAGQYKYSFENGNDDAWKKFSADLANKKASPAVSNSPFTVQRNFKQIFRIAAAISLIAVGAWAFWFNNQSTAILEQGNYTSNTGEVKEITLKDGSVITLNANSSVAYTITKNARKINLNGMAHFEVAKNPNAPFVIRSGSNQVTVLGTGFDVRSYTNKPLQVTVNHGKVRVEKLAANNSQTTLASAILTKGMRATENPNSVNKKASFFQIDSNVNLIAVQWNQNGLKFNNAHLSDVISAVESQYGVQIEILGNAPIGLRNNNSPKLTATFTAQDNIDFVCKVIGDALDLKLVYKK